MFGHHIPISSFPFASKNKEANAAQMIHEKQLFCSSLKVRFKYLNGFLFTIQRI